MDLLHINSITYIDKAWTDFFLDKGNEIPEEYHFAEIGF